MLVGIGEMQNVKKFVYFWNQKPVIGRRFSNMGLGLEF